MFCQSFVEQEPFRIRQNSRVHFFEGKKRLQSIQKSVFRLTLLSNIFRSLECWQLQFKNGRGGFVNSTFPSKANFPQKSNSTYDKKNKSKSLRNFEISMSRKLQRNGSLPRATGPPLSALIKEQHKLHKKPFSLTWRVDRCKQSSSFLHRMGRRI